MAGKQNVREQGIANRTKPEDLLQRGIVIDRSARRSFSATAQCTRWFRRLSIETSGRQASFSLFPAFPDPASLHPMGELRLPEDRVPSQINECYTRMQGCPARPGLGASAPGSRISLLGTSVCCTEVPSAHDTPRPSGSLYPRPLFHHLCACGDDPATQSGRPVLRG